MTISNTINKVSYTGNNSQTEFSTSYRFLEDADLSVTLDGVTQTINTDYTVSGAGVDEGGAVTFTTAPGTGVIVTIKNDPPKTQETDYVENDPFPAQSHEDALDKLTLIAQSLGESDARTLKFGVDSTSEATVPEPEADKFLGWNDTGTGLENKEVADASAIEIPVTIAQGGTGASDASTALTNLGAEPADEDIVKAPSGVLPALDGGALTNIDGDNVVIDDSGFTNITGTDAQTAFSSVDSQLGSGGGGIPTVVEFTSSGSWTVPANITEAIVTLCGGGGGGGGTNATTGYRAAGGGGAGGSQKVLVTNLTPGSSITVTIGSGGTGGAGDNGTNGGATSFGSYATCAGGGGGYGANPDGSASAGGTPGTISIGANTTQLSVVGTGGGAGGTNASGNNLVGGCGGCGLLGKGGDGGNDNIGAMGVGYGSGGGGAGSQNAARSGGNGTGGRVVIEYYP